MMENKPHQQNPRISRDQNLPMESDKGSPKEH